MELSNLSSEEFKAFAIKAATSSFVTRCEQVASYCVFVYDWLLTLETESQVLAMPGLSPAKLAYIFCRYWPLFAQPITLWVQVTIDHRSDCGDLYRLPLYVANLNFAGAACVLLVRLHAFNGQRLWSTLTNTIAMIVAVTMMTYIAAVKTTLAPVAPGCYPTDADPSQHWNAGLFLAPLLWDMLITITFIFHAVQNRLRYIQSRGAIRVFVREGLMYFFVIATVHGVNATLNGQSDAQLQGLFAAFSLMFPNLLACRLVINLRQAVFSEQSRDHRPRYGAQHDEEIAMSSFVSPGQTKKSEKKLPYEPYAYAGSYTQEKARTSIGAGGWFKSTVHSSVASESTGVDFNSLGSIQSSDSTQTDGDASRDKWWNIKFVNSRPPTRQDDRIGEGSYTLSFQTESRRSDTDEQVLIAPPTIGVEGKQISPRLKLFAPPAAPTGSRSGLSSLTASRSTSDTLHPRAIQDRSHLRASGGTFGPSPVSVLEPSGGFYANSYTVSSSHVPSRARSKRPRSGGRVWSSDTLIPTLVDNRLGGAQESPVFFGCPPESESVFPSKKAKKATPVLKPLVECPPRRCSHCLVQKTPQWRAGPMGPKTLCNACGVRYKSGRLVPEYRPAGSPSFVSEVHSNSHKRIMEMRRMKEAEEEVAVDKEEAEDDDDCYSQSEPCKEDPSGSGEDSNAPICTEESQEDTTGSICSEEGSNSMGEEETIEAACIE